MYIPEEGILKFLPEGKEECKTEDSIKEVHSSMLLKREKPFSMVLLDAIKNGRVLRSSVRPSGKYPDLLSASKECSLSLSFLEVGVLSAVIWLEGLLPGDRSRVAIELSSLS